MKKIFTLTLCILSIYTSFAQNNDAFKSPKSKTFIKHHPSISLVTKKKTIATIPDMNTNNAPKSLKMLVQNQADNISYYTDDKLFLYGNTFETSEVSYAFYNGKLGAIMVELYPKNIKAFKKFIKQTSGIKLKRGKKGDMNMLVWENDKLKIMILDGINMKVSFIIYKSVVYKNLCQK